ncbi:helix-turn-helix domain-containing protein [Streptomyces noursei]|uniref:helix-turn-helix domain-containing protein n=1 Tax=Streptomyces noursei TaxID=1971 RepID=UPI0019653D97|nr:helix-turn-helix transcriptional regulator [Streptomyces noursei]QRX94416.1 helix-turn-helix transcriptional regulator [Streptomyces noursei]
MHQPNKPKRITSWHVIGAQLSHFRRAARLTQPALAETVGVHEDTIGSIEQGRRALKIDLAEAFDEILDTKGALAVAVKKVPEREKLPAFVHSLVEHEEEALTLLSYENQVMPGLLQTARYARAVFDCLYPPLDEDEADAWVSARLDRQKLLERKKPRPMLNFILEEVVLHRPVGGPDALRGQLRHLRQCAELPFLGLQIMPTSRGTHASLDGPLVLLETPDHDHLAYIEAQRISFLVDDPDQVSVYQQVYGMLRSQALTPEESKSLLDDLLGES